MAMPIFLNAQKIIGGKNIIKTNLFGNLVGNYNVTYERAFAKKLSFSLGLRYMPKTNMPSALRDVLEKQIDDKNMRLEQFEMGNFAITPELRLYLSAGKMKGFYIAPYARYASFDLKVPLSYDFTPIGQTEKAYATFTGKFTSISGGLLLGTQFQIAKKLVLDFWIIGAHYGSSSGEIIASDFNPSIDPNNTAQTTEFKKQVESVNNNEYGPFKFKGQVSSDYKTAKFTTEGAWAGVRALGLSLGIRF